MYCLDWEDLGACDCGSQEPPSVMSSDWFPFALCISLWLDGTFGFSSCGISNLWERSNLTCPVCNKGDVCGQTYPTGPVFLHKCRDLNMPSDLHPHPSDSIIIVGTSTSIFTVHLLPPHACPIPGHFAALAFRSRPENREGPLLPAPWSIGASILVCPGVQPGQSPNL